MTIPVIVYIVVILIMNWQAIGLLLLDQSLVFMVLVLGSLSFTFSDAVLAYDMFKKPFRMAEILILSSYWIDRKSTRLNSSHVRISYAVFCLKKKRYIKCTSYIDNESDNS